MINSQHYDSKYLGSIITTEGPLSQQCEVKFFSLLPISGHGLKEPLIMTKRGTTISIIQERELSQFYGLLHESFMDEAYEHIGLDREEALKEI